MKRKLVRNRGYRWITRAQKLTIIGDCMFCERAIYAYRPYCTCR